MVLVIRNITKSGWYGERIHDDTGEFSRTEEQNLDTTGSKPDRTRDLIVDIVNRGGDNVVIPQSVYDRTRQELGWDYAQSYSNIRVVPDAEAATISSQGHDINENIEARKAAIQEQRRQGFEPSSLAGRENIERSMLAEKAGTDWNQSFAGIVERSPGVREKLEQSGILSYEVAGKKFSKREVAEGYAAQLNREEARKAAAQPSFEKDILGEDSERVRTERWRQEVGNPLAPKGQSDFESMILSTGYKDDPKYGRMYADTRPQRTLFETIRDDSAGVSGLLQGGVDFTLDTFLGGDEIVKPRLKGAASLVTGVPALIGSIPQNAAEASKEAGTKAGVNPFRLVTGLTQKQLADPILQTTGAAEGGAITSSLLDGVVPKSWRAGREMGGNPAEAQGALLGMLAAPFAGRGLKGVRGVAEKTSRGLKDVMGDFGSSRKTVKTTKQTFDLTPPADYPFDSFGGESGVTVKRGVRGMELVGVGATTVIGVSSARATPTENQLKAYDVAVDYSTGKPEVIKITKPQSPSKIELNLDKKGAVNFSKGLAKELETQGFKEVRVDAKGRVVKRSKGFSVQATDEILSEPQYFNQWKEEAKVKHRKNINIGDEVPGIQTFEGPPKRGKKVKDSLDNLIQSQTAGLIEGSKSTFTEVPYLGLGYNRPNPKRVKSISNIIGSRESKAKSELESTWRRPPEVSEVKYLEDTMIGEARAKKRKKVRTAAVPGLLVMTQPKLTLFPPIRKRKVLLGEGSASGNPYDILIADEKTFIKQIESVSGIKGGGGYHNPAGDLIKGRYVSDYMADLARARVRSRKRIGDFGRGLIKTSVIPRIRARARTDILPNLDTSLKMNIDVGNLIDLTTWTGTEVGTRQRQKQQTETVLEQRRIERVLDLGRERPRTQREPPRRTIKRPPQTSGEKKSTTKRTPLEREFERFEKTNPVMDPWATGGRGLDALMGPAPRKGKSSKKRGKKKQFWEELWKE